MADIVFRDRNGDQITYPGVNYINVNTADGGTQGFASYDPETLTPENLVDGVVVGDVVGAQPVYEQVEKTIAPDFSSGDMTVVPDSMQLFSKVTVNKPENLLPENIALDVEIAGVKGTLDAGSGGGMDEALKYFICNCNEETGTITIYGINYALLYADTGSCDVTIPDTIAGMNVVVCAINS